MPIKRIDRTEYKLLLDSGIVFRDWSLYEPTQRPDREYLVVDLGSATLNKVAVDTAEEKQA